MIILRFVVVFILLCSLGNAQQRNMGLDSIDKNKVSLIIYFIYLKVIRLMKI